ncbi:MAG TPA: 50S ribosomal protein L24, partial [Terriglobia bacterium]|nr:50S ribosomal protein L24 [Terriglobia bacterium]
MPTVIPIKKNDDVFILRGKDRGKSGRVLVVIPDKQRIVVEGVQMIKRHTRPNPQKNIQGGIVEREASVHISNVAILCKNCRKHTRLGSQVLTDGRKVRVCK